MKVSKEAYVQHKVSELIFRPNILMSLGFIPNVTSKVGALRKAYVNYNKYYGDVRVPLVTDPQVFKGFLTTHV